MTPKKAGDEHGDFTPVTRLELKRVELVDLIRGDELLKSAPLFKACGESNLPELLKLGLARRFPDKAPVFREKDAGDSLYFVLRGEVRLYASSGRDVVELGSAAKGEVFGEDGFLNGGTGRASSAVAAGELDAVEIPTRALQDLSGRQPALKGFLVEVSKRRRAALDEMAAFLNRW